MSFSQAIVNCFAVFAAVEWIVRIVRADRRKVRPGRTHAPMPDRAVYTSPRWDSHETEQPSRHVP